MSFQGGRKSSDVVVFQNGSWIGLHTYGEIGPVAGRTWFHNYTAVLCALYAARTSDP